MSCAPTACATCPSKQLVRLGVDTTDWDFVVALAGNPNTGKSTVFNALTGLRQHTGNWPGKTVSRAEGGFEAEGHRFKLIDLPGTYSLLATSPDEEIARDFVLFGQPHVTVVVVDATCLERNLNLVLQVLEITDRVVVCLNLMDEAERTGVLVDADALSEELGVPVIPTAARYGRGLDELRVAMAQISRGECSTRPRRMGLKSASLKSAAAELSAAIRARYTSLPNPDWVALRLLDGDRRIAEALDQGELEELYRQNEGDTPSEQGDAAAVLALAEELRWRVGPDFHQTLMETIYAEAAEIADQTVKRGKGKRLQLYRQVDRVVTSRKFGLPIMLALLALVFWLTVAGANVPSAMLGTLFLEHLHPLLKQGAAWMGMPWWLDGLLIDGMYLATAWVVSVMLPPMAIFFPLFTLLEDLGYLPRVAFNLDSLFRKSGAHGKQALTMAMGFGCNAAGVVSTRIIESPRERLIAIITNNFALCNGRWPTQILVASIFIGSMVSPLWSGLISAAAVVGVALLGIGLTFATSWLLSRTVLRGEVSSFSLELPPYRPPRLLQTLYTSLIDRTIFVLWRAVVFALPAGAAIWLVANVQIADVSLAEHLMAWMDPFGMVLGLSGLILLAYVIAIPANEIVVPTILMLTVLVTGASGVGAGTGVMFELDSQAATGDLLRGAGWTLLMAVNLMLFSLVHNPCSTTIYTIWKETRSARWTALAALLPLVMGFALCFVVAQIWRVLLPLST